MTRALFRGGPMDSRTGGYSGEPRLIEFPELPQLIARPEPWTLEPPRFAFHRYVRVSAGEGIAGLTEYLYEGPRA